MTQNLPLLDKLCGCFERVPVDLDEDAAAEMMRVIRAVAGNQKCTLMSDGPIAPVLRSSFKSGSGLWKLVELKPLENT